MKKIYFTLSIIAALIFTACNGTGNQEGYSYDIFSGKVKTKLKEKYYDVHSHMENGLCIVWSKEEGHKIGFINAKGKEVIPCIYDAAMSFSNQYAAVAKEIDGKKSWGFIDKKGKEIVPCIYKEVKDFSTDGLAAICINDEQTKEDLWGFVNTKGEITIPATFNNTDGFSEGMARVYNKKERASGYINTKGELVIPYMYDMASYFSEGIAWVEKDDRYFTINKNNETIFKLRDGYEPAGDFHDGLAVIESLSEKVKTEWWTYYLQGYVNKKGEFTIPVKYLTAEDFKDGIAEVKTKDEKTIYINTKGEEVEIDD